MVDPVYAKRIEKVPRWQARDVVLLYENNIASHEEARELLGLEGHIVINPTVEFDSDLGRRLELARIALAQAVALLEEVKFPERVKYPGTARA